MISESNNSGNRDSTDSVCGNHTSHIDDVYLFGGKLHPDDDDEVYQFENIKITMPEASVFDQRDASESGISNPFIDRAADAHGKLMYSAAQLPMKSREASASLRPWVFGVAIPSFAALCVVCCVVFLNSRQTTNHTSPPVQDLEYEPSQESTMPPLENQTVIFADVGEQSDVVALYRTGNEHYEAKRYHEAIRSYEAALTLAPNNAIACNNLALILATCPNASYRHGARARTLSERACSLTNNNDWKFLSIRAAAEAECGDFINAIKYAKLAEAKAPSERRVDVERMLEQLQHEKPYRWP